MGAQVTIERVTYETRLYAVDNLGYLFCGRCLDRGCGRWDAPRGDRPGTRTTKDEAIRELRPGDDLPFGTLGGRSQRCDGCDRPPSAWDVYENDAIAAVEHPRCVIF